MSAATANFADALGGRAGLDGIRWMLCSGASRKALRRALGALLPTADLLGPCALRYVRFGPGPRVRAYYDALVRLEDREGYGARPVAVTWASDDSPEWDPGMAVGAKSQAEAVRRGVAAPFQQLAADVPAWGMQVQVSPLDAHFPQLVRLSDARYARQVLARAHATSGIAEGPDEDYAVACVRYRPGKRHVLRYDSLDRAVPGSVFAKVYSSEKGQRVFRVATCVEEWLAAHDEGVTSVKPLAFLPNDAVVLYPQVLGTPLCERLHRPDAVAIRSLRRAGAALRALHRLPRLPAALPPLPCYDFAATIREVERDIAHIPALLPLAGSGIGAILSSAQELHERLPGEPPTFTHRDFKCEHLLVAPGRLTLIDFDRCAVADPAFDVGKFLADLHWWFATYAQDGLEQAQAQFLAGYGSPPDAPAERLVRARLYEAVELVQMTILRARLFERHAAGQIERLVGRTQVVMRQLRRSMGVPRRALT